MADEDVKIEITTKADTKGAKETEEAFKAAGEAAEKAADPERARVVAKSMDDLEQEISSLRSQLRKLPVDSDAFREMARKVSDAEKAMAGAEQQARKLGATTGRRGDAGMALLEFSRAFEDFQFAGIRGAANNLPGLLAMLGAGPGLAGMLSLAVVGATALTPLLAKIGGAGDEMDGTNSETKKLADLLKEAADSAKQLKDARAELAGLQSEQTLSTAWSDQKDNLDAQTRAAQLQLEILKERERIEERAVQRNIARQINDVEARRNAGQRSPDEADRQLAALRAQQTEARLRSAEKIAEIDRQKADEEIEGAQRIREEAARRRNAMEAEVRKSTELQQRLVKLIEEAQEALGAEQLSGISSIGFGASGRGFNEAQQNFRTRLAEIVKQLQEVGVDIADGAGPDQIRKALEVAGRRAAELGEEALGFQEQVKKSKEAMAAAEESLKDAIRNAEARRTEIDAALEAGRAERESEDAGAGVSDAQEKLRNAEQQGAATAAKLLEEILDGIANAAEDPQVQNRAEAVRKILADGLQRGEESQVVPLLSQLVGKMEGDQVQRAQLFQKMIQGLTTAANGTSAAAQALEAQERRLAEAERQIRIIGSRPSS